MKYVYRVVNAILGALVFVAAFFTDFLKIEISVSESTWEGIKNFVNTIKADTLSNDGYALVESFSIQRMINVARGKDELSGLIKSSSKPFLWPEIFKPINVKLGFFAAFFVLMLLTGLFIIIWSCVSNKRLPVLIAGVAGIGFDIGLIATFKMWATPLADGTIDVASWVSEQMFGNSELLTGTLGKIVSYVAGITMDRALTLDFALCGLQNAMLFIFIAVICWSAIFYLVELGDTQTKENKLALAAYKEANKELKTASKAIKALKADDSADENEIKKAQVAYNKAEKAAKAAYDKTEDGKAAIAKAAKKKAKEEKKAVKETEE